MGRRRRKWRKTQLLRPPRKLPTIFDCPNCGARAMVVEINKKQRNEEGLVHATIKCGKCGLVAEMWVPDIYQPVDVYNKFVDLFLKGEAEYRILKEGGAEAGTLSLEALSEAVGEETGEGEEYLEDWASGEESEEQA